MGTFPHPSQPCLLSEDMVEIRERENLSPRGRRFSAQLGRKVKGHDTHGHLGESKVVVGWKT